MGAAFGLGQQLDSSQDKEDSQIKEADKWKKRDYWGAQIQAKTHLKDQTGTI